MRDRGTVRACAAFMQPTPETAPITNSQAPPDARHLGLQIGTMLVQKRVEAFLKDGGQVLGLAGPSGTGKLYGTEAAAKAVGGFCLSVLDRAQGVVNYNRLGAYVLGAEGLARSLFVVCNADAETDWSSLGQLRGGATLILIGNDGHAMKRAGITVEQVRRPTVAEMTRTLFCDQGMEVTKAQRLAHLSNGDWRALKTVEAYFAQIDIGSLDEGDFELAVESTAKDKPRAESMHPSFAAHLLFNGQAKKHCGGLEELADYGVLAWGEKNLGVACETIGDMARLQEAASLADTMVSGCAAELGLDHFARSAALEPRTNLRYDYKAYSAPEGDPSKRIGGREASEFATICSSWERRGSWHARAKRHLAQTQESDAPAADRSGNPQRTTKAAKAKKRPAKAVRLG